MREARSLGGADLFDLPSGTSDCPAIRGTTGSGVWYTSRIIESTGYEYGKLQNQEGGEYERHNRMVLESG